MCCISLKTTAFWMSVVNCSAFCLIVAVWLLLHMPGSIICPETTINKTCSQSWKKKSPSSNKIISNTIYKSIVSTAILRQALTFYWRLGSSLGVIFFLRGSEVKKLSPWHWGITLFPVSSPWYLCPLPGIWHFIFWFSLSSILPPCLPALPLSRLSSLSTPSYSSSSSPLSLLLLSQVRGNDRCHGN